MFRGAQDGRGTPSGSRAVLAAPSSPLLRRCHGHIFVWGVGRSHLRQTRGDQIRSLGVGLAPLGLVHAACRMI